MARLLIILALLTVALATAAPAQESPEDAARAFGAAAKTNDWAAAARMMHPSALKQLRDLFEPIITAPGMEEFASKVFGIGSSAELAATPDTVLFANFLKGVLGMEPAIAEAMKTAVLTPLGHVPAGADTVLVVSRMQMTVEGMVVSQFDVMPFIHQDGRWWGLLKADFTNMAAMLQRAMGARRM